MKHEQSIHGGANDYIHQGMDMDENFTILDEDEEDLLPDGLDAVDPDEQQNYTGEDRDDSFDLTANRISPNAIELAVRCEIGMVSVSLERLTQLRVGDILELSRWPNTVKLTANGGYFAEGILVEVDGMLGVKLTRKLSS